QLKSKINALTIGFAPIAQRALRQRARSFNVGRIVEKRQGLQRRIGHRSPGCAFFAVRRVEQSQRRRGDGALPNGVQPAAVEVRARRRGATSWKTGGRSPR